VDLHVNGEHSAKKRVSAIRGELDRLSLQMPLSAERHFALVYCDGVSASEGFLMQAWYASGRFPCLAIGGSAGGPLDLGATFIGTRQGVVQHKAAVIFCEMARGKSFAPFKSQNFEPTNQSWLVAQADPVSRTVHSVLDAHNRPRPVIEVLCEHFRCQPSELGARLQNMTFAVKVDDEFFIRSVASIGADHITFFCDLEFGDRLHLLRATPLSRAPSATGPASCPASPSRWACCSTTACCAAWAMPASWARPASSTASRPRASPASARSWACPSTRPCRPWSSSTATSRR
jgi:hypothetical protein